MSSRISKLPVSSKRRIEPAPVPVQNSLHYWWFIKTNAWDIYKRISPNGVVRWLRTKTSLLLYDIFETCVIDPCSCWQQRHRLLLYTKELTTMITLTLCPFSWVINLPRATLLGKEQNQLGPLHFQINLNKWESFISLGFLTMRRN
jgi:hypothetical protein